MAPRGISAAGDLTPAAHRKPLEAVTVKDLQDRLWRLRDHRGQVVLLNFWATWCPPCRRETPGLVELANSHRENELDVVGISMDDGGVNAVREFVAEFKIPYTVAIAGKDVPLAEMVQALPTTLLIDRRGRIAKTYLGGASESTFRTDVDALLREEAEGE